MARYHYGTVPVLAWIINHYFYGGVHYTWLAEEFYPLAANPKSSNPCLIYQDLYWAWARRDPFDRFIKGLRASLSEAVRHKENAGSLDNVTAARLRRVCSRVSVELFYPVTYRVDIEKIDAGRCVLKGSAAMGSREVLVPDLAETEFDLLFADNHLDPEFQELVIDEIEGVSRALPATVLDLLERRRMR
jgi:hypothetical protein